MKLFHELFTFFFAPVFGLSADAAGGGTATVGADTGNAGQGAGNTGSNTASGNGSGSGLTGGTDASNGQNGTGGNTSGAGAEAVDLSFLDKPLPKGWAKAGGFPDAWESKFTTLKPALGSYAGAEKLIGAKGIIPPGPNATQEEKSAFFKALGRPDKPEEYGIKMPEKIGDKAVPKELWDQNNATAFAKWAHEKGWSKQQVQDAIEFDMGRAMAGHEAMVATSTKARTDAETALKTEHGAQYPEFVAKAERGAAALGLTKEMVAADPALANNPNFIRMAAKVAEMIGEKGAAGARGTTHATENPQAKIDAIMADKSHPWHQKNASKDMKAHNDAVLEMQRLYKAKHGEV